MKNFLSKRYEHYYVLAADGQWVETTRAECFARCDVVVGRPHSRQRWFFDGDSFSYIVRLPLGEQSEALHRLNESFVKAEERYQASRFGCVLKDTGGCNNDCDNCQRKKYPRIIELDKSLLSDGENDNDEQYLDFPVCDNGYSGFENKDCLDNAMSKAGLMPKQRELIEKVFFEGYSIQEVADAEGVDKSAISHRLTRAYKKLKTFLE